MVGSANGTGCIFMPAAANQQLRDDDRTVSDLVCNTTLAAHLGHPHHRQDRLQQRDQHDPDDDSEIRASAAQHVDASEHRSGNRRRSRSTAGSRGVWSRQKGRLHALGCALRRSSGRAPSAAPHAMQKEMATAAPASPHVPATAAGTTPPTVTIQGTERSMPPGAGLAARAHQGRRWRKGVGVEPTRHAGRVSPVLKTGRPTGVRCPSLR
jgi:hypothetical protein